MLTKEDFIGKQIKVISENIYQMRIIEKTLISIGIFDNAFGFCNRNIGGVKGKVTILIENNNIAYSRADSQRYDDYEEIDFKRFIQKGKREKLIL